MDRDRFISWNSLMWRYPSCIVHVTSDAGTVINTVATVFSIFTALLLSLLMLTYNLSEKISQSGSPKASQLLRDTIANISFMILISIFTIFNILLLVLLKESELPCKLLLVFLPTLSGIGYFLLLLSGFTILMILKRIRALFSSLLLKCDV